jgi:hydroxymethylbilane synthase
VKRTVRVGSRDSVLAVKQTRLIMDALARVYPGIAFELVTMKTAGDLNLRPFDQIAAARPHDRSGAKGLFIKELEQALLDGRIDLAVHSLKDMPMKQDERLPIRALFRRGDPRDALVPSLGSLESGGKGIGCSSARRRLQLAKLMPGCSVLPVRGNVLTRLKKLDEGEYGALVLAAAGLRRLDLEARIARLFEPDEMVPAAGQGILACQGRSGEDCDFLDIVNDRDSQDCAGAERAFVARLGGGCSLPAAAYAEVLGTELRLTGFYVDESAGLFRRGFLSGSREDAVKLGETLALRLWEGDSFER